MRFHCTDQIHISVRCLTSCQLCCQVMDLIFNHFRLGAKCFPRKWRAIVNAHFIARIVLLSTSLTYL